ncbi:ORF6N domain-containing protein [Salmonella enterica]|nr:ORF6N domain-containing protein [Salmonella enterica]
MTTQISVETLSPITHNQIPVITTELLAHLYGTKIKNISDNFLNNTSRFVVGKHFFKIEKNELREFKNRPETIGLVGKNARSLILWTERGAARHAKMLETDQAWEVFEKPEDCYFSQTLPSPTRQVQPAVDMLNIDLLIKIRDGIAMKTVRDYVKEHNLVIMKSLFGGKAGEYWSIPLPYGYNMFYLLGSTAEGVTRGNLTASKAAGNIVGGMLGAFNPLGSEDSKTLTGTLFKNAAPTILRPVADLWANESFMGTPIYQENFPTGTPKPESTLGRRSTPEAYKAFANWLNTLTGGSQYRSGALDINPDEMKYWIDYVSGGMGRFAGKTIDAAAKTYNGTDIPPQQIPFLGKISGKVMPYADQQAMYDHIDELRQYNAELKSLSGADRAAFRNKYSGQLSMNGIIHQSEIQLKNLRKQRDEVYSDPTLTARQQADRVLMIEQNMKKVVDSFNQEYREMTGE